MKINACDLIDKAREELDSYELIVLAKRDFKKLELAGHVDGVVYMSVGSANG